jgi:ArsR family transcriptional regulator, arsenate/arsenite/antimonite-responsive transcriptional repressor
MVEIFKALSEESRLRILSMLLEDEMCVCEIEICLKMTQSNVSRHLTALKKSGILESYKKAQWNYYKINESFIKENEELWTYLEKRLKELPFYDEDYREYKKCKEEGLCANNK